MVRNHHEKYKDMAESVLPSTRRRAAREDRQAIHQRHRAQTRAALADYRRSGDPVDVETHVRATPDREIHDFVWDRRSADKVGPLIRWAIRRVERDPQLRDADVATQTAAFRSMFPDNLIGRHAIDHIRWALTWRAEGNRNLPRRAYWRGENLDALDAQVRSILENGQHSTLNAGIRSLAATDPRPSNCTVAGGDELRHREGRPVAPYRMLRGAHDIDEFVRDIASAPAIVSLVNKLSR